MKNLFEFVNKIMTKNQFRNLLKYKVLFLKNNDFNPKFRGSSVFLPLFFFFSQCFYFYFFICLLHTHIYWCMELGAREDITT